MSEELIQRNLIEAPEHIGPWDYYNIGSTTLKALKAAKIIPQKDYADFETKKPDALIVMKPLVIAAIEYKQSSQLKTKKQIERAIQQELGTAQILNAKVYIVTDGKKTFWINPHTGNFILSGEGEIITTEFSTTSEECVRLLSKIISSISRDNDNVLDSSVVDPLPLAQQVWQDLWAVTGATPENCLYSFVETFIFKYLSDLGVLSGLYSFTHLRSLYKNNGDNAVLEYYANTVRPRIKELFPGNTKDNTTIINGTIFVSKDDKAVEGYATVFKKITERFEKFGALENIDYDFKSKLFETFLKESISKKNWGQFFTPIKVVRSIVSMADIQSGMSICDPACGVGKFLLEPILHDLNRYYKIENGELKKRITLHGFDKGFDRDEQKTIILAKANMLIYLSSLIRENPAHTVEFAKLFNDSFLLQTNSILGTLAQPIENAYDLILTNPPYVMSGSSNLKEEIAKQQQLKNYYAVNAMGIEGLFMEWIVRALKPGGKAFIVVPDGIMNRSNDRRLRDFIINECNIDAVISLPINTFFTTNKKTYILALTKKVVDRQNGIDTKPRQSSRIFTYLCSEIGETRDVYRFELEQNDLAKAADLYNMFKGSRGAFSTDDKRCKLVTIDSFMDVPHWSVERWWTLEERVELGIEEKAESVTMEEMGVLVGEVASSLLEYQELFTFGAGKKKEHEIVNIPVNDLFTIKRGSGKYTKAYTQCHLGEFPLYSGNTFGEFAHIDSYDYDTPCLTWAIDGLAGYMMVHRVPFAATNHRGILLSKRENIDLDYVKGVLEPLLRAEKKGRVGDKGENEYSSLTPSMIADIKIPFPIDENGRVSLELQREKARQFLLANQLRDEIAQKQERIRNIHIELDLSTYFMSHRPLCDIFDLIKGKGIYTRKYGDIHKGNFPVFSAASSEPLTYINTYDFDGEYLSWSTNGFAGRMSILKGKFSINADRGILIPRSDLIDIGYIRYVLEPTLRNMAKGRKGDNGKDEFTKLYPSMIENVMIPLPVDAYGAILLDIQREIADKYTLMEQLKSEVLEKLSVLQEKQIQF